MSGEVFEDAGFVACVVGIICPLCKLSGRKHTYSELRLSHSVPKLSRSRSYLLSRMNRTLEAMTLTADADTPRRIAAS
jgi:hypothetical protein